MTTADARRERNTVLHVLLRTSVVAVALALLFGLALNLRGSLHSKLSGSPYSEYLPYFGLTLAALAGFALTFVTTFIQAATEVAKNFLKPWSLFATSLIGATQPFLLLFAVLFGLTFAKTTADSGPLDPTVTRVREAMTIQGYTAERAKLLDHMMPAEYYFARFPVMFAEGDIGVACKPSGDFELADVEFVRGIVYDPITNNDVIKSLIGALSPCASSEKPVLLKVEGYASSKPFPDCSPEQSESLNVRVANERRKAVETELRREKTSLTTGISIELAHVEDYTEIEDMIWDREFDDRPEHYVPAAGDQFPQDLFTLAAHIKILSPGRCAPQR